MKRKICLMIGTVLLMSMTGCGGDGISDRNAYQSLTVKELLDYEMKDGADDEKKLKEAEKATEKVTENATEKATDQLEARSGNDLDDDLLNDAERKVDVDLTKLSATMVYSEVYNMFTQPDNYLGKIVKMEGQFVDFLDPNTGNRYFSCIVKDATACCAQGIEFVLEECYSYPDDYPEQGMDITVIGEFSTYMEGDQMYCTLKNAELE